MKKHLAGYVFHILFIVVISLLVCSFNAYALTINLPDCSQSTIQGAITSASEGDIIICPAGNWSWSNVDITKNITLQGAGIGNTNISITSNAGLESPATYSGAFRVTGFTFIATSNFGNWDGAMLYIRNGHDFRVDHNEFQIYSSATDGTGGNGVHVKYDASGLFDHNRFVKGGGSGCMHVSIQVSNSGTTNTSGDAQEYSWTHWESNYLLGSADHTIFIEDNYFYNPDDCDSHPAHTVYGRHGSVVVFRHNEVHQMNFDNHGFRAEHSGYVFEISNNDWYEDVSGTDLYAMFVLRGGTGVIYNNVVHSGSGVPTHYGLYLWTERCTSSGSSSVDSSVPGYGNVAANTACNSNEGHPCAEQVGRGMGNSSDPLYVWGNSGFASTRTDSCEISGSDYYVNQGAKPGYTAYTYPHPLQGGSEPPPSPPPALIPSPPSIIGVN